MRTLYQVIIIFLLLCNAVSALDEKWYYTTKTAQLELKITAPVTITGERMDWLSVKVPFYPRESYRQQINTFTTSPTSQQEDNYLLFRISNPTADHYNFIIESQLETINIFKKVRNRINFPIEELPDEVIPYLEPTEHIDSDNPSIIAAASHLAEGEGDLFKVANKIAIWTRERVEYNLSTQNVEASFPASWVLENKQGVCDELTNLYIALLRAVGIPAKFVSGISYTNSPDFADPWGPHGWAEVYFPGVGWVPFDVTYGELSHIDPSHIKLSEGKDSEESATTYSWQGAKGAKIISSPLIFETKILTTEGRNEPLTTLSLSVYKDSTSFDSYNLVEATISNLADYYITPTIILGRVDALFVFDNNERHIVLEPGEQKKVFWIIKFNGKPQNNIFYTIPLIVYDYQGTEVRTNYTATSKDRFYTLEEMGSIVKNRQEEEIKVYSRRVDLTCSSNKKEMYDYEDLELNCTMKNLGNIYLSDLLLCANECQGFSLGIGQSRDAHFAVIGNEITGDALQVTLSNTDITKSVYVKVDVKDRPEIDIKNIQAPTQVGFQDTFIANLSLGKKSLSEPINVKIILINRNYQKEITLDNLRGDKEILYTLKGRDLKEGMNTLAISISYEDTLGKKYRMDDTFTVELTNVGIFQKFLLVLRGIGDGFISLFA